jgi:hypothetical protein
LQVKIKNAEAPSPLPPLAAELDTAIAEAIIG